ncbi:molybdopterin-synthase adenylyltransferase MoeB [Parasulfuritortus cantonensis]|uniref:Molybdopterin-synthase adenylyltransferase n=1 Tax=Parasulfuritortus cantonensis TaxID=2528202 RepID=A0A4R1B806_9PROT|nr:molybdopterin-synthase adenylyltransferase MoeB [Parasulfuritortus cantonensis]TCJ12878.1 molybdopterin-synthase adenylyltransferase MoeB [Parasulfuritortus cantonensis]
MDDSQLLRYSRHLLLEQIGIDGQARLAAARVLIVGAGGLGSPVALYLAAAGVGHISLADHDAVDLTNLQRQIAHDMASLGENKAASAARRMAAMNPDIEIAALPERLAGDALGARVAEADLVLDCSDNFATRHAVNRACVAHAKPLVSGAAVRFDGQVSAFDLRRPEAPCYACLFPENARDAEMRCAEFGVFAPLVGIIGAMQAAEALKLLMGIGTSLSGRLLLYDALAAEWRAIRLKKDPGCPVCSR